MSYCLEDRAITSLTEYSTVSWVKLHRRKLKHPTILLFNTLANYEKLKEGVVLEDSNIAKLVSTPYLAVHSLL